MTKDKESCCPKHVKDIPRINKIIGQLEGIKKMVVQDKYCVDILTQIRAANQAVKSLERNILKEHLKTCVRESFSTGQEKDKKIEELIEIIKRF